MAKTDILFIRLHLKKINKEEKTQIDNERLKNTIEETSFESFIEPLKFITDKILWRIDQSFGTQGSLEDFFI